MFVEAFFRGHTSPSLCIAELRFFCDRLVHAYFSATTWNSVAQTQVGKTVVMSTGLKPHPIDWACLNIGFPFFSLEAPDSHTFPINNTNISGQNFTQCVLEDTIETHPSFQSIS